MKYSPSSERYSVMKYRRCGKSGLLLPAVSLGLWHNFGDENLLTNCREMIRTAFDMGITHFDLANNYGPHPGSAERNFGRILKLDFPKLRDELIISSKAGYHMWDGPYGDWGSRKYLISSIDQSLKRTGLDYFDIFYHHRRDPETPMEETMSALDHIVKQGKALYAGISNYYSPEDAAKAFRILKDLGTPCVIHQVKYNMFDRRLENGLLDVQNNYGAGCIVFSPLEKGILTEKYLNGIPSDSRAAGKSVFLKPEEISEEVLSKLKRLNIIASERNQSLAQMALSWNLRLNGVTSVLIGASKPSQIVDCAHAENATDFTDDELQEIEKIIR